jgi:hypothetical protein
MQNIMSDDLSKAMQALSEESQMVVQKASMEFFGKMNTVGPVFEKHFDVAEDDVADSE